MARQCALQPADLNQIDADAGLHRPDYFSSPTISFAVARSPSAPEPSAM
jgi:hypothetical protein